MKADDKTEMRRVRPWIAGMLTLLGWGLGLYYAHQRRAAVRLAVAQVLVATLAVVGAVSYLFFAGPTSLGFAGGDVRLVADLASLFVAIVIAIGVFLFVARSAKNVEKASPARLLGYVAIWGAPILASVVIALTIRVFLFQPFDTPAGSMAPTLKSGEFFVVEKWAYGYSRASFFWPLTQSANTNRMFSNTPERGDVVVFKNRKHGNRDYVKRVIGLPGDEIRMVGGVLHINGDAVAKEFAGVATAQCDGRMAETPSYVETLNNGVRYRVYECHGDGGHLDNIGPFRVPDEHYFMMGDNRDQSQDSRISAMVGFIPAADLVGRVKL